ncbi:ProQ/FINO family protein [Ramlibacter tataouinensis]|uniref:ProQ/FINO family protein n=1 Tax=Ramlibacter tataouinensis TaxID=94132 RepID=UPI0022F402D0|nr:ProQ/FINO family protein [Ramlibacter tataouinensis]WBY00756.1 ProQ/FINO family protein [Ramlibacter tataouinensis]
MNENDTPAPVPDGSPASVPVDTAPAAAPAATKSGSEPSRRRGKKPVRGIHPLLHTLFELYPGLFGVRFLPLKLGVFEDLRTAHPDRLPADELKVALGLHTRSNRYLEAVAGGLPRHDLGGQPVEPVAPEHVHHAIVELYRRKSSSPQEAAARQRAVSQLAEAIERSGLGRDGYRERFGAAPEPARGLLEEALMALGQKSARVEALRRAFEASGKTAQEFAEMYGLSAGEVRQLAG